jgi:hypothetical protein
MDEITLLTATRPAAPDFDPAGRAAARDRLLAAAQAESAGTAGTARPALLPGGPRRPGGSLLRGSSPQPGSSRWHSRRRLGMVAAAAAVVAVATGVVVALPGARTGPAGPAAGPTGQASLPGTPASQHRMPATASAVLLLAAQAAASTPDVKPRPGQFVFTEQLIVGEDYSLDVHGKVRLVRTPPNLERSWASADGRRDMLRTQRNLPDGRWFTSAGPFSLCESPQGHQVCYPGYVTSLPRTVRGMRRYLLRSMGPNGTVAYRIMAGIGGESWQEGLLIPNRSYALMFRTAASVPGIQLVRHAVNVAGQAGIAVAACMPAVIGKGSMKNFHGCPERTELIFDARTYELIGVYYVAAKGRPPLPGRPSSALVQTAVVNRLGQLP